jgi:hypothetical protein
MSKTLTAEGFTLRLVENQGADLTVVLPDFVDGNAKLSNSELEQVAGGNNKCQATVPIIPQ